MQASRLISLWSQVFTIWNKEYNAVNHKDECRQIGMDGIKTVILSNSLKYYFVFV